MPVLKYKNGSAWKEVKVSGSDFNPPIGYIYFYYQGDNNLVDTFPNKEYAPRPAQLFGGTWIQIAKRSMDEASFLTFSSQVYAFWFLSSTGNNMIGQPFKGSWIIPYMKIAD